MTDYLHHEYPKTVGEKEFWKQIKRTVNGADVSDDDINLILNNINSSLKLISTDNLLDLGCGNAALAFNLFDKINLYHGVDFSDYLLQVAKKNFHIKGKTSYQKLNLRENFNDIHNINVFNKVLCFGSFSYFGIKQGKLLLEMLSSKKEISDIYLGNIPNIEYASEFFSKRNIKNFVTNDEKTDIGVWWEFDDLYNFFKSIGFQVRKINFPERYYASNYRFDLLAYRG